MTIETSGKTNEEIIQEYHEYVASTSCARLTGGWLWYCDEHEIHGSATSEDEARCIAEAHTEYWFMGCDPEDYEECDIWIAEAKDPDSGS